MDRENLATLKQRAPRTSRAQLRLFLEYIPDTDTVEVPDPYYGGPNGFEHVLDLVEAASDGLLRHLRSS